MEKANMSTPFRDIETKLVHCGERVVEGAVLVKPSRGRDCPCPFGPRRHGSHIDREAKPADCSARVDDWLVYTLGCSALGCIEAQVAGGGLGVRCRPTASGGWPSPHKNGSWGGGHPPRIPVRTYP